MSFWRTLVGKLWMTIIGLVACVLIILGLFLLPYIDLNFTNSKDIKRLFTYVCIIGFSMTTFFALFLLTKITQPMQQLIRATDAIRRGEYGTRLSLVTSDEIGQLASTFNHMASELEKNIRSLNQEKEHLTSVLRSMSDAVITFDNSGKIILTNPPGDQLLERWLTIDWEPRKEAASIEGEWLEVPEPLHELFEETLKKRGDCSSQVHVKQGVWSVYMAPLYEDDVIRGAVAVLRDITEEVALEKMRTDFVANVSHEIRTPLSMMQGYSEALLDGMAASPEETEELIQVIHDESVRMGRLVNDLLDLARMEAGHSDMLTGKVKLDDLLGRIYRKFLVRSKEVDVELHYEYNTDLVTIPADQDKLEQVMTNLLDNAFRYTPAGKKISILVEETGKKPADAIRIIIRDEGVGVPKEDLPYLFERFYKADKARVRGRSGGTGLGLAIVKNIIDAHGGTIMVDSELGQGTTFTIQLPIDAKK